MRGLHSMKINVEAIDKTKEEQIIIQCYKVTEEINEIVDFLKSRETSITAYNDSQIYNIALQDIYYIESVDNKTFAYLQNNVYEIKNKLYELEFIFNGKKFFRCSKSVIVNLMKIEFIKPALNGRFVAKLKNNEEIIISRKYVSALKKILE
ncbi:MAG: response regulator of the LytR/AlgR family [Bacillota bacterium]|nr:response regulator of the LytR/AlgR family [Bacillota bacterium]